jgi:hypothetical protein
MDETIVRYMAGTSCGFPAHLKKRLPLSTMLNGPHHGPDISEIGGMPLIETPRRSRMAMYSVRDLGRREILIVSAVLAGSSGVVFSCPLQRRVSCEPDFLDQEGVS